MRARPSRMLALVASLAAAAPGARPERIRRRRSTPCRSRPTARARRAAASRAQPGRYVGVNVTLMRLVRLAYRPIEEFDGGPEWKDRDHFDVEAVTGATAVAAADAGDDAGRCWPIGSSCARTPKRARCPVYELSLARPTAASDRGSRASPTRARRRRRPAPRPPAEPRNAAAHPLRLHAAGRRAERHWARWPASPRSSSSRGATRSTGPDSPASTAST